MARDAGSTASAPQGLADVTSLHLQRGGLLDRAQHQHRVRALHAGQAHQHLGVETLEVFGVATGEADQIVVGAGDVVAVENLGIERVWPRRPRPS
jgi:hypothetical protein